VALRTGLSAGVPFLESFAKNAECRRLLVDGAGIDRELAVQFRHRFAWRPIICLLSAAFFAQESVT